MSLCIGEKLDTVVCDYVKTQAKTKTENELFDLGEKLNVNNENFKMTNVKLKVNDENSEKVHLCMTERRKVSKKNRKSKKSGKNMTEARKTEKICSGRKQRWCGKQGSLSVAAAVLKVHDCTVGRRRNSSQG